MSQAAAAAVRTTSMPIALPRTDSRSADRRKTQAIALRASAYPISRSQVVRHAPAHQPARDNPLSEEDRAKLALLFNKYRMELYRYIRGLAASVEDVQDIIQETYMRVMRHTENLHIDPVARAYLFRTATNIAHEYYRRRTVRRYKDHVSLEDVQVDAECHSPEVLYLWQEAHDRLKAELSVMPRELREVVQLKRFERKTYSEIAETLGVSTRTVERRMVRALEFLTERMECLR